MEIFIFFFWILQTTTIKILLPLLFTFAVCLLCCGSQIKGTKFFSYFYSLSLKWNFFLLYIYSLVIIMVRVMMMCSLFYTFFIAFVCVCVFLHTCYQSIHDIIDTKLTIFPYMYQDEKETCVCVCVCVS